MTGAPTEVRTEVLICARRDSVFRFFTDTERFARWWGEGSRIDPRPGGAVLIRYPGGDTASGSVVAIEPPERIVFTYGYDTPGKPIPPGGSRVTVTLHAVADGTRVVLVHDRIAADVARSHVAGWRYQLATFAKVASADAHADVAARVDAWFAAWDEKDAARRRAALAPVVADGVTFRNDYACVAGVDDLLDHIAAAQIHLPPGIARDGAVAFCQGTALARWRLANGMSGTNVFDLDADGRIVRVVGFWDG